jgi:hypothetical protein
MSNDALRAEHDAVLSNLSTRDSTHQFAHAAVSLFLSVALFGTSARLWIDYGTDNPEWTAIAAALGVVALGYSVTRFAFGGRAYSRERTQVTRLLELRKTLGVDAPAAFPRAS